MRPAANLNKAKPIALKDFNLDGLLCAVWNVDARTFLPCFTVLICTMTFTRTLKSTGSISRQKMTFLANLGICTGFIAEQLYAQGQFSHYVVLVGTHNIEYRPPSYRPIPTSVTPRTSSIHQTSWTNFKTALPPA